ncbi:MAG TPA: FlgD immunoglobulin-like domain containing protein [Candidatus Kapabacteria bacterium]|nr:FlgD immunoglobulin-like domain containing protein [Candidatus Kapabacteria bacterium]HVK37703.1 FlgD immunoglobulin-like domain containing protein [Candidatus Kapabacteria bacterium]
MITPVRITLAIAVACLGAVPVALELQSSPPAGERTYVGSQACAGCHAEKHSPTSDYQGFSMFQKTTHQKIQQRPTPQTVIIDNYFRGDSVLRAYLAQVPIPGKDTLLIHLSMTPDRKNYRMQMSISGGGPTTPWYTVTYTHGGNGWKQRYLVDIGGVNYVGPFQFVMPGYRKRDPSHGEFYFLDVGRWIRMNPETSQAEFINPNSNEFKSKSWDHTCAPCHTTGSTQLMTVNGADTNYKAVWPGIAEGDSAKIDQNVMVGCESCHGPGSEHVASPSVEGSIINPKKWGATREATDLRLDLCGQCHTRSKSTGGTHQFPFDEVRNVAYVPGQPLKDFIGDAYNAMAVWPDRKTSYAHHQAVQDYQRSGHYDSHTFNNACWDCHTVHYDEPGRANMLKGEWYSMKAGDGCMKCHADKLEAEVVNTRMMNKHSHHPQSMSQCVNCHMTKTASIGFLDLPGNEYWEFTKRLYDFSTHTFNVLAPEMTIRYAHQGINLGMMNTCAESCHRNGRGSRNSNDTIPEAPYWGVWDNVYGLWNQKTDLDLADTLMRHYNRFWGTSSVYTTADPERQSSIVSIAPIPVRASATIELFIAPSDRTVLEIYDTRGLRVYSTEPATTGPTSIRWEGTDQTGRRLASGTYFVRLKSSRGVSEQRIALER